MREKRFSIAAFLAAVIGALLAAFVPTGRVMEGSGAPGGVIVTRTYSVSMFQTNGAWLLFVASVPVLLTLVPILVRNRVVKVVSTVLLWVGCILGMFSVGMFFIPAAILMTFALRTSTPAQPLPVVRAA